MLVAGLGLAIPTAPAPAAGGGGSSRPPNIVLIRTDDQTEEQLTERTMPRTLRLLAEPGTRFTNSIVTTPQCCPSRASVLTGQYGHNNGVLSNKAGYPALGRPVRTLPAWLNGAGYTTAHVGKWMKGWVQVTGRPASVPPHWDQWHTTYREPTQYYGYVISDNGRKTRYDHHDRDYVTRVLNRKAEAFVRRQAKRKRPFYLQLDHRAPHASTFDKKGESRCAGHAPQPDPRDKGRFENVPLPRPPSFDEADVSDKPPFLRRSMLDPGIVDKITDRYQCALASLRAVDRGVRGIVKSLKRAHALGRTAFIFTSDNGYLAGEHRISNGKTLAYEESTRVPLVIRLPRTYTGGAPQPDAVPEPVANIDLTATILDLARARPCTASGKCRVLDGRSLAGLAAGRPSDWPADRGLLVEYDGRSRDAVCAFSAIRVPDRTYVEYSSVWDRTAQECRPTAAVELYDLQSDPFELENLCRGGDQGNCPTDERQAGLRARLEALRNCAGIEGRDEPVNGRPFCE
jgi:arylsulfatase A-like enzyme